MNSTQNNLKNTAGHSYTDPSVSNQPFLPNLIFAAMALFFASLIPLPFNLLFLILASFLTAKAFSAKFSHLVILSLLPALVFCFFTGFESMIVPAASFVCGFVMAFILKKGGNKTVAVIGSTTVIVLTFALCLCLYVNKNYGGISSDDFYDFISTLRQNFSDMVTSAFKSFSNFLNRLPETPQKTTLVELYRMTKEAYSDTDIIFDAFLYTFPGVFIMISNVFSYVSASLYYFSVREATGHKISSTSTLSQITISNVGVIIFGIGFFLYSFSMFFSSILGVIGFNFVLIYAPALFIIGIKVILDPEARKHFKLLIGITIFTLFFNPVFALLIVSFIGANATINRSIIKFVEKNNFDDKK